MAGPLPEGMRGKSLLHRVSLTLEERRRMGGPGLRTLLAIAGLWGLDDVQHRRMLGDAPEVDDWIAAAREHRPVDMPDETLERIGVLLTIHAEVAGRAEGIAWLTDPALDGRTPLDLIASGSRDGQLAVLDLLRDLRLAAARSRYEDLRGLAVAIHGPDGWIALMAHDLDVDAATVQSWVDAQDVPLWVGERLPNIARAAYDQGGIAEKLRQRLEVIERFSASDLTSQAPFQHRPLPI